jgi:ribosomal protein S18 acetylase RimI-like enzyme
VVVGYLVGKLGTDDVLRVDQVWVTPQARENGFGDALLAGSIEIAQQRGAVAVEGQALPGDRQTKNLYERAGIVARLITTFRWL